MTKNKKSEYTRKQVIGLLLSGMSISNIAREVNVSDTTIDNWLKDKDFKEQLKLESDNLFNAKIAGLMGLIDTANKELRDILENSTDRNKLQAIKLIYELIGKYQNTDLLDRIEILENKIENNKTSSIDFNNLSEDEIEDILKPYL